MPQVSIRHKVNFQEAPSNYANGRIRTIHYGFYSDAVDTIISTQKTYLNLKQQVGKSEYSSPRAKFYLCKNIIILPVHMLPYAK